jgi:hypothetical protein
MTAAQHLARRLRVPIKQSKEIAYVLGSPVGLFARAVENALHIA